MNPEQFRALLRHVDDPVSVERPSNQDIERDSAEVIALVEHLRVRFGDVSAEIGPPLIQDASHLAHITVPPPCTGNGHGIWIRISNFGRLASAGATLPNAHGGGEIAELIDPDEWRFVLGLIESHDYIYVPQDILLDDYDGRNGPLVAFYEDRSRLTWWVRFFDWI